MRPTQNPFQTGYIQKLYQKKFVMEIINFKFYKRHLIVTTREEEK